jgi:hypothetical protein
MSNSKKQGAPSANLPNRNPISLSVFAKIKITVRKRKVVYNI